MVSVNEAEYRSVAGHFATGVVVVAAMTESGPVGFTCQSFHSLSLEPILVAFAARVDGVSWPLIRAVGTISINVLEQRQMALAERFARSAPDKFEGVAWTPGPAGAPLLAGALAQLEAGMVSVSTFGDHDLAVAHVSSAVAHPGSPLLYYRGEFGSFQR
jgi:flavin reductase (DIM6/NTAB) family NADH-FMN oxidoreductase RutF